jgi:hypothetical protein
MVGLAIVVSLVSLWTSYLRACSVDAANHATCRPLQITDPVFPLLGLLVICIAWPEIKSLKLAGFEVTKAETLPPGQDLNEQKQVLNVKFDDFMKKIDERKGGDGRGQSKGQRT